jgi:hypothetical protein
MVCCIYDKGLFTLEKGGIIAPLSDEENGGVRILPLLTYGTHCATGQPPYQVSTIRGRSLDAKTY